MQLRSNKNSNWVKLCKRKQLSALSVCVALLGCASPPAQARNEIFFTMDPTTAHPTVVAEPMKSDVIVFRSVDYISTTPDPESFVLVFESSFVGKYETAAAWTPGVDTPLGVMFQSTAGTYSIPAGGGQVPVYEVKIKLKSGILHPPGGYKYDLIMGGESLDPRVVPR